MQECTDLIYSKTILHTLADRNQKLSWFEMAYSDFTNECRYLFYSQQGL